MGNCKNCFECFRIDKDHPGAVFVRENATSQEVAVNILKAGAAVDLTVLPSVIPPSGLDAQRQWYLFNEMLPIASTRTVVQSQPCQNPSLK